VPKPERNLGPRKRKPDVPIMDLGSKDREHKVPEFKVRLYTCCKCGCREAGLFYEFVEPGKWKCERCAREERDECKEDTVPKSS
jgi:hypothetical protein